jgi:hypothetical protein
LSEEKHAKLVEINLMLVLDASLKLNAKDPNLYRFIFIIYQCDFIYIMLISMSFLSIVYIIFLPFILYKNSMNKSPFVTTNTNNNLKSATSGSKGSKFDSTA